MKKRSLHRIGESNIYPREISGAVDRISDETNCPIIALASAIIARAMHYQCPALQRHRSVAFALHLHCAARLQRVRRGAANAT